MNPPEAENPQPVDSAVSPLPAKKRMPLWAKILLSVAALVGIGLVLYVGFILRVLFALGSAGTEYNEVLAKESARIKTALAVSECPKVDGGEASIGNLDAIEKYRYTYTCDAVSSNLDQLVGDKLSALGYANYQGLAGIYRNDCCEIQYESSTSGYVIGLYSNQVSESGREEPAK